MIANRPLNSQAIAIEEAETKIRLILKEEFLKGSSKEIIAKKVKKIISDCAKSIKIKELETAAVISLIKFYLEQYRVYELNRNTLFTAAALAYYQGTKFLTKARAETVLKTQGISIVKERIGYVIYAPKNGNMGVPLQEFSKTYDYEKVSPVVDSLCKQEAKDPGDVSGRNSLRNRAEMEVRYNDHLRQIEEFRYAGVKLVIASTHADCSERCSKWQGKVYSLDGTYGKTDDGRDYQPLENATDIFYTTKAGKTYKNGLLGFNCRHYLVPYQSGYVFPKPNVKEERRQYGITLKQRELERNVREWRIKAVEYKGANVDKYRYSRQKAIEWNKAYIKFSKENNRAFYPSRTEIL